MTEHPAFLATLEAAAHAADAEETAFRREATASIETLERARTFAFRRLNVLRAMLEAARRAPDPDASIAAQLDLIRDRLGWATSPICASQPTRAWWIGRGPNALPERGSTMRCSM